MSDDDGGPPPLEDMSECLAKLRFKKSSYQSSYQPITVTSTDNEKGSKKTQDPTTTDSVTSQKKQRNIKKNDSIGYAGMKKGFLFGGNTTTRSKMVEIKANPKARDHDLQFKEVQDKMNEANDFLSSNSSGKAKVEDQNEWVTPELLAEIQKNEKLSSRMGNPEFMAAFGEFQQNATRAMKKYGGNKEMQEFIQSFAGILGSHFTKLGERQDIKKAT